MLIDKFTDYIAQTGVIEPSDKLLVGVSGGVDSSVMLDLLVKGGYNVVAAHCNFGLRGEESDGDQKTVEKKCAEYGIELHKVTFDTYGEMERSKDGVQVAARRLRYDWFESLCKEYGYNKIAVAHNADDSIETFFINLIRGCGLKGLTGINNNGKVIRPLLFAHRRDIMEYAIANKILYREDSSNSSTKYLRNKLRLGVIPKLREISLSFGKTMTNNLQRLTDCQDFIETQFSIIREQVMENQGTDVVLDISKIDTRFSLRFVIRELIWRYGFNDNIAENICKCYSENESGKKFFSPNFVAYLDRKKLIIKPILDGELCEVKIEDFDSSILYADKKITFKMGKLREIDSLKLPPNIAIVDADKLQSELVIRRWKSGDTFTPYGMVGKKKVSDFLIDKKMSLPDKERQTVITSGDEIVWLVGQRIDDGFKITENTNLYLQIIEESIERAE